MVTPDARSGSASGIPIRLPKVSRSPVEKVLWLILGVLLILVAKEGLTEGIESRPLRGDQASHVFQAISLADLPPDLTFDERDFAIWQSMDWTAGPDGLIFHRNASDITAGKPYGYSLVGSVFVAVLGPASGMGAANVALFLTNVGIIGWLLALRYRGAVLPLAIGAFALASSLYLNVFIMQPELFMSTLVGIVCIATIEGVRRNSSILAALAFATAALLAAERLPLVVLLAPPLAWVLWQTSEKRKRVLLIVVGMISLLVAILPYLAVTGGDSPTAYGGSRFYLLPGADSWPPLASSFIDSETDKFFSVSHVAGQLSPNNWGDIGRASIFSGIGRNTGMLVFMPMALLSFLAVLAGRPWRQLRSPQTAWLVGVMLYVAFHVVILTDLYWGGGQTLGNKYLLQIFPAFVTLLALSSVSGRVTTAMAGIAIVLAVAGMGPKLWHPANSLWAVWQNTAFQDVLPYEYFALDPNIYPPLGDG